MPTDPPYTTLGLRQLDVIAPFPGQCAPVFLGRARPRPGYHLQYGPMPSDIAVVAWVRSGTGEAVSPRWHRRMGAGEALLLPVGDRRWDWIYHPRADDRAEHLVAFVRGTWFAAAVVEFTRSQEGPFAVDPTAPVARRLLELTRSLTLGSVALEAAEAMAFAADLLAWVAGRSLPAAAPDPITRGRQRLASSLDRPCRIGDLACDLGLTREHFTRAFAARYGLAPAAWHRRERLRQARHLLTETDLGGKEIAARLGFATAEDFIRAFRALYGLPPQRWREHCGRAGVWEGG